MLMRVSEISKLASNITYLILLSWSLVYTRLDSLFRSEKAGMCEYGSHLSSFQLKKIRENIEMISRVVKG